MTQQLAAFLVLVPALLGHGLVWSRLFHRAAGGGWSVPSANPGLIGIAGIVGLETLGTLLHFFVALSPAVAGALALAGWALLLGHARRALPVRSATALAVLAVTALSIAFVMLTRPHFAWADTGLYHWPAIKWLVERPLAFGLANLHFRLGFNSSWHVFGATAHLPGLGLKGVFALNGIFLFFAVSALFLELHERLRSEAPWTLASVFLAVLLALYALRFPALLYSQVGNLGNDGAVAFCYFLATYLVLAWLEGGERRDARLASLLAVALFALLAKPSGAAILPGAAGVVAWRVGRTGGRERLRRLARGSAVVCAAVLLPWIARGYALSGCLYFPLAPSCVLEPAWGTPPERAADLARRHRSYARYGRGYENALERPLGERLRIWSGELLANKTLASGIWLGSLGLGLLAGSRALGRRPGSAPAGAAEALCFAGFCAAFWLFATPGKRFGLGPVVSLGVLLFSSGVLRFAPRRLARAVIPCLLCAVLARLGLEIGERRAESPSWRGVFLREEELPSPRTRALRSRSGHVIRFPPGQLCWDAPLPCARNREVAAEVEVKRFLGRDLYRRDAP